MVRTLTTRAKGGEMTILTSIPVILVLASQRMVAGLFGRLVVLPDVLQAEACPVCLNE